MINQHPENPPFWRSRTALAFLGFAAIAAFFLLSEHRAHALGVLPFALVALCPLLHLFGHGGHGHDHGGREDKK
ncbi:MAG: DUF2933 domain-containing protein [Gammaproteobacteria bacterium]|nr:DUF2933 domain-containing protein [Gammaproteobacteria bacterium]